MRLTWSARRGVSFVGLALAWMVLAPTEGAAQTWTGGPTGPIYYNGGSVGIGVSTPATKLDTNGSGHFAQSLTAGSFIPLGTWPNGLDYPGQVVATGGSAGFVFFDRNLGSFRINAGDWYQWYTVGGTARLYTPGPGDLMAVKSNGNVGIGVSNPLQKLAVNGTIAAKDIMVTNAISADYVFEPGYRLRPLSEVDAFIQANRHLPDIPSAAEVEAQGVSVGVMQAKLLAKIEELTLHQIRQERENEELRERLRKLESRAAEQ